MDIALENVLKYDFYSEKMGMYSDVIPEIMFHIISMNGFNVLTDQDAQNKMKLFSKKYPQLLKMDSNIHYKYQNMMDEIFDDYFDDDFSRHKHENYIEDSKIIQFNRDMESYERAVQMFIRNLHNVVQSLSLSKMFVTDMLLLKGMEHIFDKLFSQIESIEESMGKFEDTFE